MESGVLLPREARELLEESVREIRSCPLSEHPGAVLTEEDEEDLNVEDAKALRQRKRTKQKSLL